MTGHGRPTIDDWRTGVVVGASLGAIVLGVGGRLGMRAIALAQGQSPSFTIDGSIAVVLLGGVAGAVVALIFLLALAAFPAHRLTRGVFFWTLLGMFVWRGLNPISALNVGIFAPLFVLHGVLLTVYWCRIRFRRHQVLQPGA